MIPPRSEDFLGDAGDIATNHADEAEDEGQDGLSYNIMIHIFS